MCFFNPKLPGPQIAPVAKADPVIKTAKPLERKLQTADDATKSVKFGDTARAASTAKSVGSDALKIPLNQNKTGTKTGGINVA